MNDGFEQEPVELLTGVRAETMFDDGLSDEALDRLPSFWSPPVSP